MATSIFSEIGAVLGAKIKELEATTLKTGDSSISGDLVIDGTVTSLGFIETSSERFKENIKPLENAFETVSKLQGVSYDWKETGVADIGFIAEQVNEVVPQIVKKSEDGTIEGLNYAKLTALLVEVVKDQQTQIDELRGLIK